VSEILAATWGIRAGMAANHVARRLFYRSTLITRMLFGAWHEPCDGLSFFELGTVVMRRALVRDLRNGMRVLEVGTGPYAVLALWAAQRYQVTATGTEIEPRWAERARAVVARHGVPIEIHTCDLMNGITGPFDAIWFVPPFLPRERFDRVVRSRWRGNARELELLALRSVGGERGSELIARFYTEVAKRLSCHGRAYVCLNAHHLTVEGVASYARASGLRFLPPVGLYGLPYRVEIALKST
jgi:methylase of polypeptide subunit release factors